MTIIIINADDYGVSDRFDAAIIDFIAKHQLSSVSVIVTQALQEQFVTFRKLCSLSPSHLNKHNWEQSENEEKVLCDFAIKKNLPVRIYSRSAYSHVTALGDFVIWKELSS